MIKIDQGQLPPKLNLTPAERMKHKTTLSRARMDLRRKGIHIEYNAAFDYLCFPLPPIPQETSKALRPPFKPLTPSDVFEMNRVLVEANTRNAKD